MMVDNTIMTEEITLVDVEKEQHEVEVNGVLYVEEVTYRVFSDGSKAFACSARYPKETSDVTLEPTQLDVIEANTSYLVMMMEV